MTRVLVATDHDCPAAALAHAAVIAGREGEVVLASVLVVPHAQPLEASLGGAVDDACAALDQGEAAAAGAGAFDTRLLRARSFSEGVLGAAAAEPYDMIVLEAGRETPCNGAKAQIDAVIREAGPTVVLVRPG